MLSRRLTQIFLVCLAATLNVFAQTTPGSSLLFQLPGTGSGGNRLVAYGAGATPLSVLLDTNGPLNAEKVLVAPDGSKVYVLSDGGIQVVDPSLQTFTALNGVNGPITNAEITPDGKYLLVQGSSFYIINTQNNSIAATNLGLTGALVDWALSPDGKKAWLLQSFSLSNAITPINLTNLTVGTRVDLPYPGARIAYSPLGQLYTTSGGRIVEYNPTTLALVATIDIVGVPGKLYFSPDGTRAFYVNQTPEIAARSIQSFRTAQRDVTEWPAFSFTQTAPFFDELFVASADRLFAFQRSAKQLWEITPAPLSGVVTTLGTNFLSDKVYAVAMSNEYPSARFLYVLAEDGNRTALKRISLANNSLSTELGTILNTGVLRFAAVPPTTGVSNFVKFNDNQLIAGGGAAKKLILRATDAQGRPVFNAPVSFTVADGSNTVVSNASTVTTANGYADADATIPNTPGTYTINAVVGGASTTFTLSVPGSGGGVPGGSQRISIYSGDGQVLREFTQTGYWAPLTVKVVDEQGNPMAGVPVSFSVTEGSGVTIDYISDLGVTSGVTDSDGLARGAFFAQNITNGHTYELNIVRAESPYGTAEFTLTVVALNQRDASGAPDPRVQTPDRQTIGRGDTIKDFFVVQTKAIRFPDTGTPLPNISLRVGDRDDWRNAGPGACVNNTKSDNLGISRCDFKSTCSLTPGSVASFQMVVGEYWLFPMFVNVTAGSAQKITLLSGNNQTGNVGQTLGSSLVAQVTDGCGSGVAGKTVVWTVTQGSATLSNVVTSSGSDGRVSARVTLGQTPGPVRVRVTFEGADPVIFSLTNNVVVSGISLVSGGGQTATVGANFANPIVFVVRDASNNPVQGVQVAFSATGAGSVSPTTGTTDSSGRVQTTATAANTTGNLTVTASALGFTASATVTAVPAGLNLTPSLFTNAASGAAGLVPCGLVTISAPGLAPNVTGVLSGISAFGPLPYQLGPIDSITVTNGSGVAINAPIQAVSNQNGKQQVNFQVPCEAAPGTATVVIRVSGQNNTVTGVPVLAGQPGIFTYAGPNNKVYGAVIRLKDGSYITPSNPAVTGESYWMVLTGMGQTSPALTTNSPGLANQTQAINLQTIVGVNNQGVPAQQAKYLPGSIGVYYVEFTIPKAVLNGANSATDLPLAVAVINNGNVVFGNPVLLPALVAGQ